MDCCFTSTFHAAADLKGSCCFLDVFAQDIPNSFGADSSDGFTDADGSDVIGSFFKGHKSTGDKCCQCIRVDKFCAESFGQVCNCFAELLTGLLCSGRACKPAPVVCIETRWSCCSMRLEGDRSDEICINLFIDAWRRGNEGAGEERGRMNGCWFWVFFLEGSQNVWRLGCNSSAAVGDCSECRTNFSLEDESAKDFAAVFRVFAGKRIWEPLLDEFSFIKEFFDLSFFPFFQAIHCQAFQCFCFVMRPRRFLPDERPEDVGEEKRNELHGRLSNIFLKQVSVDLGCSFSCFFSCWELKQVSSPSSGDFVICLFRFYFNLFEGDVGFPPFCFLVEVCLFESGIFIGGGRRGGGCW